MYDESNQAKTDETTPSPAIKRIDLKKPLFEIIKLREPMTHGPWEAAAIQGVIIKGDELFNADGSFRPVFYQIKQAGDIHKYLGYEGLVIFSPIMPDSKLLHIKGESYAEVINTLRFDYYITPDRPTYLKQINRSAHQIDLIMELTRYLLSTCPNSIPMGLVKGGNVFQIRYHAHQLRNLGIKVLIFHVGDFFRRGKENRRTCVAFTREIRKEADLLFIYGIGSRKSINKFRFADGFITQSHFVNGFRRQHLVDGLWRQYHRKATIEDIRANLKEILKLVEQLERDLIRTKKVTAWIKEAEQETLTTMELEGEK